MDCVLFRTIANFIMWRLVDSTYLRLGEEFEQIFKNFYIQLDDHWVSIPREELCLQLMKEKYFDTPLSRIYVDKLFNGDSKKIVRSAFVSLMFAMLSTVSLSYLISSRKSIGDEGKQRKDMFSDTNRKRPVKEIKKSCLELEQ